MLSIIALLALLALWATARLLEFVLEKLRLDPWEVLLYLGLAEHDLPPRRRVRLS